MPDIMGGFECWRGMKEYRPVRHVFLDIDGVLHPAPFPLVIMADGTVVSHDVRFVWLPTLAGLLEGHAVSVVIHSSWRHEESLENLKAQMSLIDDRIIGVTEGDNRWESIQGYCEQHNISQYRILDDNADEFPRNLPQLIRCDGNRGVSCASVQQKILGFLTGTAGAENDPR